MKPPHMTPMHFEYIARIINHCIHNECQKGEIALIFRNYLKATNPKFNSDLFLRACLKGDLTLIQSYDLSETSPEQLHRIIKDAIEE